MSGVCGIHRFDGAAPEGISAMARHLERRGPDGTHVYRDGPVALGHTLLVTTPEALHETMPLTHRETGCTIIADVRLDNRGELITALGLGAPGRVIGDGEIILNAWLKWGEDCPVRLLGDFVFAIWDPRSQVLFCARDQMGMKQLIHCHVEGKVFAFASEPQAVLQARDIPRRVNEARVADFFEGYLEDIDFTSTFFDGVLRLPPAHRLTVGRGGLRLSRYWSLEPNLDRPRLPPSDVAAEFRAHFDTAVQRRMRAPEDVLGAMLSGGIDSNSVAAVAAQLRTVAGKTPLRTYSAVGPDPVSCVETGTIRLAQTHLPVIARSVDWSDLGEMEADLFHDLLEVDDPFDAAFNLVRAVYRAAAQDGRRVMLDGVAGDVTLSVPMYLPYLLRSGHWVRAAREIRGEASFYMNGHRQHMVLRGAILDLLPARLRAELRRLRDSAKGQDDRWRLPAEFARRTQIAKRQAVRDCANRIFTGSNARDRAFALTAPSIIVGRERYDRAAARYGIEPRDPFLDLDLVQYALCLPAEKLQRDGVRKRLLRDVMADLLPEPIRFRKGKEHLGRDFSAALWRRKEASPVAEIRVPDSLSSLFNARTHPGAGHVQPVSTIDPMIDRIFESSVFRWVASSNEISCAESLGKSGE